LSFNSTISKTTVCNYEIIISILNYYFTRGCESFHGIQFFQFQSALHTKLSCEFKRYIGHILCKSTDFGRDPTFYCWKITYFKR